MSKKLLFKRPASKFLQVFMLVLFSYGVSFSQTLIIQESFEDSENPLYQANTFDATDGDYIALYSSAPEGYLTFLKPSHGEDMMILEDVDDALNPLFSNDGNNDNDDKNAYILLDAFDVVGYDSIMITLALGSDSVGTTFDSIDSLMIQYAFDDNIASGGINTGTYTTIGAFYGGAIPGTNTHFVQDLDLNGVSSNDPNGQELDYILKDFSYVFPVAPDATMGSMRIVIAIDGSEETAVDNIRIFGVNNRPQVITNTGITLDNSATKAITTTELSASSVNVNVSDAEIVYSITTDLLNGQIENTDNIGVATNLFTQQDLVDGKIQYVHDGTSTLSDSLIFKISDGINELPEQKFNVIVNVVTAVHANSTDLIRIYPNPTTGFISLEGSIEGNIEIFNLKGNLIKAIPVKNNLDVSDLEKGVYILQIKSDNNLINKRFVKE